MIDNYPDYDSDLEALYDRPSSHEDEDLKEVPLVQKLTQIESPSSSQFWLLVSPWSSL